MSDSKKNNLLADEEDPKANQSATDEESDVTEDTEDDSTSFPGGEPEVQP